MSNKIELDSMGLPVPSADTSKDIDGGLVLASELQQVKDRTDRQKSLRGAIKRASTSQSIKDIRAEYSDFNDSDFFEAIDEIAPRSSVSLASRIGYKSYIKLLTLMEEDETFRDFIELAINEKYSKL